MLTFKANMGLQGLWLGLTVSLVYCAFFGSLLCLRTDWEHEVTKVMKRLEEEKKKTQRDDDEEQARGR